VVNPAQVTREACGLVFFFFFFWFFVFFCFSLSAGYKRSAATYVSFKPSGQRSRSLDPGSQSGPATDPNALTPITKPANFRDLPQGVPMQAVTVRQAVTSRAKAAGQETLPAGLTSPTDLSRRSRQYVQGKKGKGKNPSSRINLRFAS